MTPRSGDGGGALKTCPACGFDNLPGAEECEQCQQALSDLDHPQPKLGMQRKLLEGKVADLGLRDAVVVRPTDTAADAVRAMRERKMGCVLVTEGGRLAGILTERDLLMKASGDAEPLQRPVREIMKPNPESLKDTDLINVAFHKMAVGGFRHLPVEREGRPLAIVSARDLLRYLCK